MASGGHKRENCDTKKQNVLTIPWSTVIELIQSLTVTLKSLTPHIHIRSPHMHL